MIGCIDTAYTVSLRPADSIYTMGYFVKASGYSWLSHSKAGAVTLAKSWTAATNVRVIDGATGSVVWAA